MRKLIDKKQEKKTQKILPAVANGTTYKKKINMKHSVNSNRMSFLAFHFAI